MKRLRKESCPEIHVKLFVKIISPMTTRSAPLAISIFLNCLLITSKNDRNRLIPRPASRNGTPRPSA